MRATDVIRDLQSTSSGSRELDEHVALVVGWSVRGVIGDEIWISPAEKEVRSLPAFTTNIQDAMELARSILPREIGGFGWEEGRASAKIGPNQPSVEAASPALALCVASLVAYWRAKKT